MSDKDRARLLGDSLRQTPAWNTALVILTALAIGLSSQLPLLSASSLFAVQLLIVLLSAAILGWVRCLAAVVLYTAAVLAGAPWLANGQPAITEDGLSWSAGYVVGFALAAVVVGLLARRGWSRTFVDSFLMLILGLLSVYVIAVPWLKFASGSSWAWAIEAGMTSFMLATTVALVIGALVLSLLWRRVNRRGDDKRSRAEAGEDKESVIDLTDETAVTEEAAEVEFGDSDPAEDSSESLDLTESTVDLTEAEESDDSTEADVTAAKQAEPR